MRISTAGVAKEGNRYFLALRKPGSSIGVKWEFPGGKAEPGESPEAALHREYLEEFGLDVEVRSCIFEGQFHNRDKEYQLLAFSIRILGGEPELTEHSEIRWVTLDELKELPLADSDGLIRTHLEAQ